MKHERRRLLKLSAILAVSTLLGGELFARWVLGLGTPPLSMTHPSIEYLYQPGQDVRRFGNRVLINAYGMRSPDFPAHKQDPDERRIMVFGDSVLNGGAQTDHEALATSILLRQLADAWHKPVLVGNVSAGSWGPGNWLAYAREYGLFDADAVVLVMSSHDTADNPTFTPLNPNTHPTERPSTAVSEGMTRYLPRYLPGLLPAAEEPEKPVVGTGDDPEARGLNDLRAFLQMGLKQTPKVWVLLWPTQHELAAGTREPGWDHAIQLCRELNIPSISLWEPAQAALAQPAKPYRDDIHPNAEGQKLIAAALEKALITAWPKEDGKGR